MSDLIARTREAVLACGGPWLAGAGPRMRRAEALRLLDEAKASGSVTAAVEAVARRVGAMGPPPEVEAAPAPPDAPKAAPAAKDDAAKPKVTPAMAAAAERASRRASAKDKPKVKLGKKSG